MRKVLNNSMGRPKAQYPRNTVSIRVSTEVYLYLHKLKSRGFKLGKYIDDLVREKMPKKDLTLHKKQI